MIASLKVLITGSALVSALSLAGLSPAAPVQRAHAATPRASDPCTAPLPASRVLPVASGIQTYITLSGGGYTFYLNQFGPQGLNGSVRQLGGTTPAGDAVATWAFALPGGKSIYAGLTHVFAHGAQQHVCVQGVAYLNLGNGPGAASAPAVAVQLEGTVTSTSARVDIRLGNAHYYVYGTPHVRGGVSPTGSPTSVSSGTCQPGQLTITPQSSDAGVGHVGIQFRVHNDSAQTCSLYGYPGAQLLDAQQRPLPTYVRRGMGYLAGNQPLRLVQLAPGGDAYFVLEWVENPAPGQSCPVARYVRITPPNDYTALLVSLGQGGINACGGNLTATPVEPIRFNF